MESENKQVSELKLDIEEIQMLLDTHATRPNVKTLLSAWIEKLNIEKAKIEKILDSEKPKKIES